MDTNWKKSKLIKAFLYRIITAGACMCMLLTVIVARDGLGKLYFEEDAMAYRQKDMHNTSDFKKIICRFYNKAIIGYAGIGDDKGYPLTDNYANRYRVQMLAEFRQMIDDANGDVLYYVKKEGEAEQKNFLYPIFSEYDGHLILPDDVTLCCYWDGKSKTLHFVDGKSYAGDSFKLLNKYDTMQYQPNKEEAEKYQILIAVKNSADLYQFRVIQWKMRWYNHAEYVFMISVGMCILFGILCIMSRKAYKQARKYFAEIVKKIWLEVKVAGIAIIFMCFYYIGALDFGAKWMERVEMYDTLWSYSVMGILLYLCLTDIVQNKGKVFKNSLLLKGFGEIRNFFKAKPWHKRVALLNFGLIIVSAVLVLISFYFWKLEWPLILHEKKKAEWDTRLIILIVVAVYLIYVFFRQNKLIKDVAKVISAVEQLNDSGEYKCELSKHSMIKEADIELGKLARGIENAVEEQNRSNRMKVELITNVSHDLKTPLTSIINYADLLCDEKLEPQAMQYAETIQKKSYRLKTMVQDIFDLSKATSGNMNLEITKLDLNKLIRQTLADMDEQISKSDVVFKCNATEEPLMIEADGEKLYRVFQNLFVNALQYSLENSRVHIQISQKENTAIVKVKNTSKNELDFDVKEITERFVRADSSRTTQGSGLGLSIAESFVEVCGGEFYIETDADMFTACVIFPLTDEVEEA